MRKKRSILNAKRDLIAQKSFLFALANYPAPSLHGISEWVLKKTGSVVELEPQATILLISYESNAV